ncbi:uncharacterized protein at3g49140 [Phtheirospermum japonicum]|uniref:Uncharacterized protein at3g49140 n=1 Tax=Phtheirospermum japonicum TaxID=374723 RepID=A0A830BYX5_9LAMI|nr:uncharacterized protein at3g49140 [Phtheirospermum japonicum]
MPLLTNIRFARWLKDVSCLMKPGDKGVPWFDVVVSVCQDPERSRPLVGLVQEFCHTKLYSVNYATAATDTAGGTGPDCFKCHVEPIICSTSYGFSGSWIKTPFKLHRGFQYQGLRKSLFHTHTEGDAGVGKAKRNFQSRNVVDEVVGFTSENPFFGNTWYHWLPQIHDICLSQVSVAADYSDSVPDSSSYANNNGYHPLEELRDHGLVRDTMPTSAEIARTAVEANDRALLIFPGVVHCEPHGQISWAEFQYVIDDFGDMFFEIYDGQNILQDYGASNPVGQFANTLCSKHWFLQKLIHKPVTATSDFFSEAFSTPATAMHALFTTVLIEMDISHYESRKIDLYDDIIFDFDAGDVLFADDYNEIEDPSQTAIWASWGMPESSTWTHPVYFAKCLTKLTLLVYTNEDHMFTLVDLVVHQILNLKHEHLALAIDVDHIKTMDHPSNGVVLWGFLRPVFVDEEIYVRRLFNDEESDNYSKCKVVSVEDFQYAEPDFLVHSIPSILERFDVTGTRCNAALKALCKKKGLHVEGANLIGVDSLGIDVRVSSGTEAKSECAADKQIQQLLFPRSRRKKLRIFDRPTEIN